ncbi:serine protease inhibitor Kazal-type 1-like [Aedes aegypti]|uniref:Uncharacterized protein n=1 Tax=Aedes aegypti TaxID=7159 RepID=A0A6I8U4N8_AEDAE|nr:serine protease inhibitor Kazal-type 1-like [Aedes aegypti]
MGSISLSLLILLVVTTTTLVIEGAPPSPPPRKNLTVQDELNRFYTLLSTLSHHSNRSIKETICMVPMILEPVCGSDGQTYGNQWLLECSAKRADTKLTVAKKGKC